MNAAPAIATDAPGESVVDAAFMALASAPRRRIVALLAQGPTTTPEIGRRFSFTRQALHHHVRILEGAGLITRSRRGRVDNLALASRQLEEVTTWVRAVQQGWTASLDRLAATLGESDG